MGGIGVEEGVGRTGVEVGAGGVGVEDWVGVGSSALARS